MSRFRLLGKLRLLFSHLNVALRASSFVLCQLIASSTNTCLVPLLCVCVCVCKLLISFLQRWPTDYVLHVWYPRHCQIEEDSGPHPPSTIANNRGYPPQNAHTSTASPNNSTQRTHPLFKRPIVHCIKPQYGDAKETGSEKLSPSSDHFELTTLAEADLEYKKLQVMGFHLSLCGEGEGREEEGGGDDGTVLQLSTWQDGSIRKTDFIKRG